MRLEFLIAFYRRSIPQAIHNKALKERVALNGHLRVVKPVGL
jgi:hypothetical protein